MKWFGFLCKDINQNKNSSLVSKKTEYIQTRIMEDVKIFSTYQISTRGEESTVFGGPILLEPRDFKKAFDNIRY